VNALVVAALLAAELHLPDVQLALDAPDGWSLDRDCGPVVPPDAKGRVEGAIVGCPRGAAPVAPRGPAISERGWQP